MRRSSIDNEERVNVYVNVHFKMELIIISVEISLA